MGKGDEPDDGEAVEGAAGAAGVVDKEVMVMLQFRSRRCFWAVMWVQKSTPYYT